MTEQSAFELGDPILERSGSPARSRLLKELRDDVLPMLGRVSPVVVNDGLKARVRDTAGVLHDHWPTFLLEQGEEGQEGRAFAIVPVARAQVNDKPGAEWRVQSNAFAMHHAYQSVTSIPIVYVFGDFSAVLLSDLRPGENYVVTDRGKNEHVAIAARAGYPVDYLLHPDSKAPGGRTLFRRRVLTDGQLRKVQEQAVRLERLAGESPSEGWRTATCFNFLDCEHDVLKTVTIDTLYGQWELDVCVNCGDTQAKRCLHVHMSWHEDGKVLVCDNCGIDGT